MTKDRRLDELEERLGRSATADGKHIIRLEFTDSDGIVVQETQNYFRPPAISGGS